MVYLPPEQSQDEEEPVLKGGGLSREEVKSAIQKVESTVGEEQPVPPLSSASTKRREDTVNKILDLTDQGTSFAIFGSIGIGKSFLARTILDHDRTKAKFGPNRYSVRCNLVTSLEGLLKCLSDATNTSVEQLQLRLQSSPPLLLLLDGMDSILDPLTPKSKEIFTTIQEFGNHEHVCLVTVSRMGPGSFHQIEVPPLSESDAQDIFYNLCKLGRSSAVDDLIASLDPHPLSMELLANCITKNNWDERTLFKEWDEDLVGLLKECYHQRLVGIIEPALELPTVKRLGTTARDVLEEIAGSPHGIREGELEKELADVEVKEIVDALCKSSLTYRRDGVVDMLLPVRCYFLEFAFIPAKTEEVIHWGDDCMASRACTSFLFYHYAGCDIIRRSPYIHQRIPRSASIPPYFIEKEMDSETTWKGASL